MSDFNIVMNKELVTADLLMQNEPSLPEAMRQLNLCEAIVAEKDGAAICVCLLKKREEHYEIVNLAFDKRHLNTNADRELLFFVLDSVRAQGGKSVEIGAGNAEMRRHEMLITMGFRVVAVWRDHFPAGVASTDKRITVPNRDMLRYRIDLTEG